MVLRRKRWWMPLLLSLSLSTFFQGCSSTEEEGAEDGLEVSGEADDAAAEEENVAEDEEGDEEGGENLAENGAEEEENANYEGEEEGEEESNEYAEGEENNYGNDLENLVNGNVEGANANAATEEVAEGNEVLLPNGNAQAAGGTSANATVNQASASTGGEEYDDLASAPNGSAGNASGQGGGSAPFTPAAGVLLPEMGSKMPYIMKARESLSSVAQMIYGSSDKWKDMASLSAIDNANRVRTGDVVYYQLNEQTMAFAQAYENTPRQVHVVRSGDSLSKIAQEYYGSAEDWASIWRQNGDIANPDKLEVGQTIYFLSTQALAKAVNYAKSTQLADLMNSQKTIVSKVTKQVSKTTAKATSQSLSSLSGFQIALDLVNHLGS